MSSTLPFSAVLLGIPGKQLLITPRNEGGEKGRLSTLRDKAVHHLADGVLAIPAAPGQKAYLFSAPPAAHAGVRFAPLFRMVETAEFRWEAEVSNGADAGVEWLFTDARRSVKDDGNGFGTLRPINRLGYTALSFCGRHFSFEIIPDRNKLDYDTEYEQLVGEIAEGCSELLLEGGAPTGLAGSVATADPQSPLVAFLFLRHALSNLESWIEHISRNPHRALEDEGEWGNPWDADPRDLGGDPHFFGRDWHQTPKGPRPKEAFCRRRVDSLDTPPNRFVVHVLAAFARLCGQVIDGKQRNSDGNDIPIGGRLANQAYAMRTRLRRCLASPLFASVGQLTIIPYSNQTLQKREGYRQVLSAWMLFRASFSLRWGGYFEQDGAIFDTRSVATLYEYWLFFRLESILRSGLGLIPQATNSEKEAYRRSKDGLHINLIQGKESAKRFLAEAGKAGAPCPLLVELFYNRSFDRQTDPGLVGSFSRAFRPDYTLAIYPARYASAQGDSSAGESAALSAGEVVYLHFDAKYRVEEIGALMGDPQEGALDSLLLKDEKTLEAAGTYKRADLMKMHTYNDAIRRTAGSYILFPGPPPSTNEDLALWVDYRNPPKAGSSSGYFSSKYFEILPGVGAFPMRPSENLVGDKLLAAFIRGVLFHHASRFSDLERSVHPEWSNILYSRKLREPNGSYSAHAADRKLDAVPAVAGYLRNGRSLTICIQEGWFFCRAVGSDNLPVEQDGKIFSARWFVPYTTSDESNTSRVYFGLAYPGLRYQGLIARDDLIRVLGGDSDLLISDSKEYHLFRFDPSCPHATSFSCGGPPHRPEFVLLNGPLISV